MLNINPAPVARSSRGKTGRNTVAGMNGIVMYDGSDGEITTHT